ncbi:MAG: DUF2752 domain-containing protein [Planctomycetota bacterium]|nr:DUF2752 domain-containing protein [Planctomycetota bacterium]
MKSTSLNKDRYTLNRTTLAQLFLLVLAIVAVVQIAVGYRLDTLNLIPCLFRTLTGLVCPGCGMTHACLAFARGDFLSAWQDHPFCFLLIGLAVLWATAPGFSDRIWLRLSGVLRLLLVLLLSTGVLGLWVFRLLV